MTFVRAILLKFWDVRQFEVGSRKIGGEILEMVYIEKPFKEFCIKGKEREVGSR